MTPSPDLPPHHDERALAPSAVTLRPAESMDRPENRTAVERDARLRWSFIAEPSDAAAHQLTGVLGPSEALAVAREATPHELLAAIGAPLAQDVSDGPSGRTGGDAGRAQRALARWRARIADGTIDERLDRSDALGIRAIIPGDPEWPDAMDLLDERAPHCLWAAGHSRLSDLLSAPTVSIVGSRACTPYGEDTARTLGSSLASRGVCIVSGGALGIDAAAHKGALAAGSGSTIAVLAGGLDELYPRRNSEMLEEIRERFALVSESPVGAAPVRWRFLSRNRLIGALGKATVVVEASWRSGALSTARHADDASRPVGAVPGPVTSAASAGCHRLVRENGAVLVTDASDVIDLMRGGDPAPAATIDDQLDLLTLEERRVLDAVPPRSTTTLRRLVLDSALPETDVAAALGRLEMFGHVERAGERVRRLDGSR